MKYIDEPIRKYIEEASSGQPTPGGGSIAAMAGALAGSMMNMVCNFTIGKKAYQEVEAQAQDLLKQGMELTEKMLQLAVEDTEAYAEVSKAYSLPKGTDEEKQKRNEAVQKACKIAMLAPSEVITTGSKMLTLLSKLVDIGNKNLITDTGVATILSLAAIESAILNVRINLLFIKDEGFVEGKNKWITKIESESRACSEEIMIKVNKACGVR